MCCNYIFSYKLNKCSVVLSNGVEWWYILLHELNVASTYILYMYIHVMCTIVCTTVTQAIFHLPLPLPPPFPPFFPPSFPFPTFFFFFFFLPELFTTTNSC